MTQEIKTDALDTEEEASAKKKQKAKTLKVAIKGIEAMRSPGSTERHYGRPFQVTENKELIAELPLDIAQNGIEAGRYIERG